MPPYRSWFTAAVVLLSFAASVGAKDVVKVTAVRVGLPTPGDATHASKFAAWAPVYVDLEVIGEVTEAAELVIEAPDADETTTVLAVPLDLTGVAPGTALAAGTRVPLGYVRPGGASSEVAVTVRTKSGTAISEPFRTRVRPREPLTYVVLMLGSTTKQFVLPKPASGVADAGELRGGRVALAAITDLTQLPDQWFGYDAADLVVLCTGTASDDFLTRLFQSNMPGDQRKREALYEWVRRGGRLVISVGEKAAFVAKLPHISPLLPFAVKAARPTEGPVALYWTTGSAGQANSVSGALGAKGKPIAMASLEPRPNQPARVLVTSPGATAEEKRPVAVQAALGLGRVTVVGFDLDREPFTSFPERPEFWDWVVREAGANRASGGDGKPRAATTVTEDEDEATVAIRQHNDTFDGVPVVSFGWIAMLIVLYILLIGPIEYYFLKRILGRLELTWITFPIIVITVSIAAYLSATAVKGRDLKVNKIDVVDVDVASNRIYGTTWFTVFSPRIDTYTVGVTPNDGWGSEEPRQTVVSWSGAPRGGRPGLVRRKYTIHSDDTHMADGLEKVPIQVWSTKAFTASWTANGREVAETDPPHNIDRVVSALVHPPGDRSKVIGSFTHRLPVPVLTDCVAFYAGQAYPLPGDVIVSGERVRLVLDLGTPASQYLQTKGDLELLLNRVQAYAERPGQKLSQRQQPQAFAGPLPMWGVLFHEAALKRDEGVIPRNASLRRLDLSWRLTADARDDLLNRDEVIVVGRAAPPIGMANDVLNGPYSPSKLWLKQLPAAGESPRIVGTARQETWVRFILPVR